jgi:hypothetical protein
MLAMSLNDTAAVVTIISGGLGVLLMTATLYYTVAIFRGWKPRPWRNPNVPYILPSKRAVAVFAVLGVTLLASSWIMYEWPHKTPLPIKETITKYVIKEVATADPTQAAKIKDLQAKLDEAILAKRGVALAPKTPNKQAAALPPVSGSGNAFSFGQQGGVTAGTFINQKPPQRVLDAAGGTKILSMLPVGTRKINIGVVSGDVEAFKLAQQIFTFLRSKGFQVTGVDSIVSSVPITNVVIPPTLDGNGVEQIMIGTNEPS